MANDIQQVAQDYIDAGLPVIPLKPMTKDKPKSKWPTTTFRPEDFKPDSNIAVRLDHHIVLDPESVAVTAFVALHVLRRFPTPMVHGRASNPDSHFWYRAHPDIAYRKFEDITVDPSGKHKAILEVLTGSGRYVLAPPSVHPSRETITWSGPTPTVTAPAIPDDEVTGFNELVADSAIAGLLFNHWDEFSHHSMGALAGMLLQHGMTPNRVQLFFEDLAEIDPARQHAADFLPYVTSTLNRFKADKDDATITGRPTLEQSVDPTLVARLLSCLPKKKATADTSDTSQTLARRLLSECHVSDQRPTLYFQQGTFYQFTGVTFEEYESQLLRKQLYERFPNADKRTIDEILDAVKALTALDRRQQAPSWLNDDTRLATDILACRNGLLHVPTRTLIPATPLFYSFNQIDIDYDPQAPEPSLFLDTLHQYFENDPDAVRLTQELFGYALTPDRRFQKIGLLIGPKRGGKGTLSHVLTHLIGKRNVCNPSLSTIGETFGRQGLIGKTLATVGDLRLGPRSDLSRISEVLLGISGEDGQTVHRKNKEDWNGSLPVLFLLLSNEVPDFRDASGALASRFLVLTMTKSFWGQEDKTLKDRIIATDLPGILNWALEGRERLYARGHFVQPDSGLDTLNQLDELASPVRVFLRERCRLKAGAMVKRVDLFGAWQQWCADNGLHPGSDGTFGRDLRAAVPTLTSCQPRMGNPNRLRFWKGLELWKPGMTEEGPLIAAIDTV